jgi:hypothetical protein
LLFSIQQPTNQQYSTLQQFFHFQSTAVKVNHICESMCNVYVDFFLILWFILWLSVSTDYAALNGRWLVNNEMERIWKSGLVKVLTQNLIGKENHQKTWVRIAGVLAKIQTEYLPYTTLEHYHYTILFGMVMVVVYNLTYLLLQINSDSTRI